jgi:hypothetical protein
MLFPSFSVPNSLKLLEGKEGEEKGKKKRGMKGRVVASQ